MLSPLREPGRPIEFKTYDLEWHPETLEVACVGLYDGSKYRAFRTVAEFLDRELTSENRGMTYFAHAGGTFDIQFVLQELAKRPGHGFRASCGFSGSAAVVVKVKKDPHSWRFADSFFLLRDSLANIAKSLGEAKGDRDVAMDLIREGAHHSPLGWASLCSYNALDCEILFRAIVRFQEEILAAGGELRSTIASTAMTLFRKGYLNREIPTSMGLNTWVEPAYSASRVEVFERTCRKANYFDINSSFPFSLTKPQPGKMIGWRKTLPTAEGALYVADLTLAVPDHLRVPPLPWRSKEHRIFFPTGTWRGLFDVADVELLQKAGGRIEKVHAVLTFEPFEDLRAYVLDLYAKKQALDHALSLLPCTLLFCKGCGACSELRFRRLVLKYLLNSLYGKFAERPEKTKILIHPRSTRCPHKPRHAGDGCMRLILPGVWECDEVAAVPHAHMPIAIHTTSLSRGLLWSHLDACSQLYYCDTDSIVTNDVLPTGEELGELKKEYDVEEAEFLAPKLYAIKRTDGKQTVRSKGFSRLSYEDFRKLADGHEIVFSRMARMRENLRDGSMDLRNLSLTKALRGAFPKRSPLESGPGSRPWTVGELILREAPKRRGKGGGEKAA